MPQGDFHSGPVREGNRVNTPSPLDMASLLGDDEEVRKHVKVLVIMALRESINIMRFGSEAQKVAMTRSLLPSVTKMLAAKEDGGAGDLRDEMRKMMEAATGAATDGGHG